MASFPNLLRKLRPVLTPLEQRLLAELRSELLPEAQKLLDLQIAAIQSAQRHPASREVCYYYKPAFYNSTETHFSAKGLELRFAVIEFLCTGGTKIWKAEFYLVRGHLFSIVFDSNPKSVQQRADIQVKSVRILHDPMEAMPIVVPESPIDRASLSGWLAEWLKEHPVENIAPPLSQEERQWFLGNVEATLPSDYLELTEQCEGFSLGDCTVIGLSGLYEIHLPEGDYYILAERGGGVLAVRSTRRDGIIYYLYHEDSKAVELGLSFRQAVEWLLQRPELP